jgi:hypothetical protein
MCTLGDLKQHNLGLHYINLVVTMLTAHYLRRKRVIVSVEKEINSNCRWLPAILTEVVRRFTQSL